MRTDLHPPVLTWILAGDGKALMFVNLSPTMESLPESLQSLRFARQVNQVLVRAGFSSHLSFNGNVDIAEFQLAERNISSNRLLYPRT